MLKIAINELKLVSSFEQGKLDKSAINVEGLWLQGCSFERNALADIRGKANEILQLPICSLAWAPQSSQDPNPTGTVEVPVYYSLDREKLLCTLDVAN